MKKHPSTVCFSTAFIMARCWIIVLLAGLFIACENNECDCVGSCLSQSPTVDKVTNQRGWIAFHEEEDRWMIMAGKPGIPATFDTQYLGILYDSLPETFQEIGMRVEFSGEYKRYDKDPIGPIPGQTYYYLFLSHIIQPNDQ